MTDLQSVFKDMESQKCLRREKQEQRRWYKNTLPSGFFFSQFSANSSDCYQLIVSHIITIILLPVKTVWAGVGIAVNNISDF